MSVYGFLSFSNFVMGCIVVTILLRNHNRISLRILAFSLFTLTYSSLVIFLYESGYILYMPFFFRTPSFFIYLTVPSIFLYVVFVLKKRTRLYWKDSLHLIPALVYLVDYFPFLISGNAHKKQVLIQLLNQSDLLSFREGFILPSNFHMAAMFGIGLIYSLVVVKIVFGAEKSPKAASIENELSNWLKIVALLYLVFSASGFLSVLFLPLSVLWFPAVINITVIFFVLCVILLFRPYILYGIPNYNIRMPRVVNNRAWLQNFPEEAIFELQQRFQNFVQDAHYLRKDISVKELAENFNTQPYILSAFINTTYRMRFNDLINNYRIEYIKDGLTTGKWDFITLDAIADLAGFNNRTTFLNAFKKFTGMTPTQFMKQMDFKGNPTKKIPGAEI